MKIFFTLSPITDHHSIFQSQAVLTKVQHQLQAVLGGQRLRELQSYGEGLTPADNQALPVNLPGAVSRVVVTASQIHISNET